MVLLSDVLYNYRQVNTDSVMHTFRRPYYEEYKQDLSRLEEENAALGFSMEVDLYNTFAYKMQQHIFSAIKQKEKAMVLDIFRDVFYRETIAKSHLATWSRMLQWFVIKKRYHIAYILYRVVAFCKSLRGN